MQVDDLNACLRGELSAIETYRQALEKHRQEYGKEPAFQKLADMCKDHEEAATRIRALVQQHGGTPSTDSGAWGTWSKTVMGAAKLFGDKAALKALKEGEESGLKQYRSLAEDPAAGPDVKNTASALVTRRQGHIRTLDVLMEAT